VGVLVGIDLVAFADVRRAIADHGERYLRRVYTDRELRESGGAPRRLAARLAAKEAAMKVLRAGDEPLPWHAIALHESGGGAALELTGPARELARVRAIDALAVSLARTRTSACAVVLAGQRADGREHRA
jgi:holo-[acyl-carrier protein] synthase